MTKVYKDIEKNLKDIKYNLTGPVEEVVQYLTSLKSEYKHEYHSFRIEADSSYDYFDLNVIGIRKENDKERDARLKRARMERDEKERKKGLAEQKEI